jgi:membrane-bound ClpP family serine protease
MVIFIGIALAGFVLAAGAFLFGHDHDGVHDSGHDGADSIHPEAETTISVFSIRVIGTFIMGCGAAGAIARHYNQGYMASSLIGLAAGVGLAAVMYGILRMFIAEQASSVVSSDSIVGCVGVVTTSIDKNEAGEVGVSAAGQYRNFTARATGSQTIEKGRSVRVVRRAGGDLIVEEVQG